MSSCNICAEKFNKTARACVKCICDFESCRTCIKTYLLDKSEDPHCMSCKIAWDRKFMCENFEKSFMAKTYKNHRENVLMEREIGMLQATQVYVEREIKMEKLQLAMVQLRNRFHVEMNALQIAYSDCNNSETVEKKKFVRKCPSDSCHGFLSSSLKCEICDCWACGDCHEIKGYTTEEKEQHTCNAEILESVKFLAKDSKPCPKCASLTFKIIGCNQMWCVECNTPWDWKTGRIETGTIHNPHYTEYLSKQNNGVTPRNPLDILCGRELDNNFTMAIINQFRKLPIGWQSAIDPRGRTYYISPQHKTQWVFPNNSELNIIDITRNITHIKHVEQPRFARVDRLQDNLQMRIDFMRNKIEKDTFKTIIQKKEKDLQKKTEINNILAMFTNCSTDILYRLLSSPEKENEIMPELFELKNYSNKCLQEVSKSYNCKKYEINKDFILC